MSTAAQPIGRIDYREIVSPRVTYMLYNGGDDPVEFGFGETYRIPSRNDVAPKKKWGISEDEPYPVEDPKGILPLMDGKGWYDPRDPEKQWSQVKAEEIMRHAVGDDGVSGVVGQWGVRPLTDKPELNVSIKEDSHRHCAEAKYIRCLAMKTAHLRINRKRQEEKLGPVAPGRETIAAMEYVALVDSGQLGAQPKIKFQCQDCGMPHRDKNDLSTHIAIHHPETAAERGLPNIGVGFHDAETQLRDVKSTVSKKQYDELAEQVQELKTMLQKPKRGRKKVNDVR